MARITKDMPIHKIVAISPQSRNLLFDYGLGCFGCHYGGFETLEGCATFHGVDPDEVVAVINALPDSKLDEQ